MLDLASVSGNIQPKERVIPMVYMTVTVTTEEAIHDVPRREWIPTPTHHNEEN